MVKDTVKRVKRADGTIKEYRYPRQSTGRPAHRPSAFPERNALIEKIKQLEKNEQNRAKLREMLALAEKVYVVNPVDESFVEVRTKEEKSELYRKLSAMREGTEHNPAKPFYNNTSDEPTLAFIFPQDNNVMPEGVDVVIEGKK